jgi:hypothetical protein
MPSPELLEGWVRKHILGICWRLKNDLFWVIHIGTTEVLKHTYLLKAVGSLRVTDCLSINGEALANNRKIVFLPLGI